MKDPTEEAKDSLFQGPHDTITFITAPTDDGQVSTGLRTITRNLQNLGLGGSAGGLLGGADGYGVAYENDVFMMHPYCWCEQDDCDWCLGCSCPESAFHYFIDGEECSFTDWRAFFKKHTKNLDIDTPKWDRALAMIESRRSQSQDLICDACTGKRVRAANFLHKPSGSKVFWYKWIGRSMEIELTTRWADIGAEVLASLPTLDRGSPKKWSFRGSGA